MRRDGLLRAHLAVGSRAGRRQQCEGSNSRSARYEEMHGCGQPSYVDHSWQDMTPAQRFNARDAWALVDALYFEWRDMQDARSASQRAIDETARAWHRAHAAALALAPFPVSGYAQEGEAA